MITLIKFLFIIIVLFSAFYLLFFKSKEKFKIIFEQDYKFKKYGYLNFFKNLILNIIYQSRIGFKETSIC